jgi:UDPglucose 6-dehydrogenase
MLGAMFNTLAGKKIALWGFAFKANTGDTRESPAIYIARRLIEERAIVMISDPQALKNARKDLAGNEAVVSYVEDPYSAAEGCHAIAVMTEWEIYKHLDFKRIFDSMEKPAFIFDGRNIIDHRCCFEIGFNVYPLGKPPLTHF